MNIEEMTKTVTAWILTGGGLGIIATILCSIIRAVTIVKKSKSLTTDEIYKEMQGYHADNENLRQVVTALQKYIDTLGENIVKALNSEISVDITEQTNGAVKEQLKEQRCINSALCEALVVQSNALSEMRVLEKETRDRLKQQAESLCNIKPCESQSPKITVATNEMPVVELGVLAKEKESKRAGVLL